MIKHQTPHITVLHVIFLITFLSFFVDWVILADEILTFGFKSVWYRDKDTKLDIEYRLQRAGEIMAPRLSCIQNLNAQFHFFGVGAEASICLKVSSTFAHVYPLSGDLSETRKNPRAEEN